MATTSNNSQRYQPGNMMVNGEDINVNFKVGENRKSTREKKLSLEALTKYGKANGKYISYFFPFFSAFETSYSFSCFLHHPS